VPSARHDVSRWPRTPRKPQTSTKAPHGRRLRVVGRRVELLTRLDPVARRKLQHVPAIRSVSFARRHWPLDRVAGSSRTPTSGPSDLANVWTKFRAFFPKASCSRSSCRRRGPVPHTARTHRTVQGEARPCQALTRSAAGQRVDPKDVGLCRTDGRPPVRAAPSRSSGRTEQAGWPTVLVGRREWWPLRVRRRRSVAGRFGSERWAASRSGRATGAVSRPFRSRLSKSKWVS